MLEVKDATIKAGERVLVSNFSFTAQDGKLTCVTGGEDSGKTTLLRTLMGFLPVSEGFVSIDGELLSPRSVRAFRGMIVYLPQHIETLSRQLKVPEAPEVEADEYSIFGPPMAEAVSIAAAEKLGPENVYSLIEQTIREGAEKPIIIADEPAVHLTPLLASRLMELLRQQADKGKTVLIASRRSEVMDVADLLVELPSQ
ncbi:MAG: ABC transporter ATP-binding protein [Prevotella sp.]|nr:ABC transporter ATP-binding protein [Prevotella sp.]